MHGCAPSQQLACIQQSLGIAEGVRIIPRDLRAFPIPIWSVLMVPPATNPPSYNPAYKRRALWRSREKDTTGPLNNLPLPRWAEGSVDTSGFICFPEKSMDSIGRNNRLITTRASESDSGFIVDPGNRDAPTRAVTAVSDN